MIIKYSQYLVVLYFIVSKQYHLGKWYILSQLVNDFILKNICKFFMKNSTFPMIGNGNRPDSDLKSYGMPSSHALSMGFLLTSQILRGNVYWPIFLVAAGIVVRSRFTNGHHTPQQLTIGFIVGSLLAVKIN